MAMGNGVTIAALILAGILSCQGAAHIPQPVTAETVSVTESEEPINAPVLYESWLPDDCFQPVPQEAQGRVVSGELPGHEAYPHTFTAYLPPDYDHSKQYNLLIFLGPYDGKPGDCISQVWDTWYTKPFRFQDLFDQLIYRNQVKPFILVQPDYLLWEDCPVNYDAIAQNIEEEFLPYIAEHFATYAASGSHEDLVAARDHISMGGCSLGGMYTFRGLLRSCTDVASTFCPMSCYIDITKAEEDMRVNHESFPVRRLCYVYGGFEEEKLHRMPDYLKTACPDLFTEENLTAIRLDGTHHFYSTWAAGLWNALQLMWTPNGD